MCLAMATRVRTKGVVIEGVEKRTCPTKHYVYILQVEMSDESTYRVCRRYKEFLNFQTILCSLFPKESGSFNKAERILPFIPGKAASGKNHLRCTAIQRISHLEEFCKRLVQMPDHISQCHQVKDFFAWRQEDEEIYSESDMTSTTTYQNFTPKSKMQGNPSLDPTTSSTYRVREKFVPDAKHSCSQIPLSKGETVEVIEKLDIGWWYVEAECGQGWVPGSCLQHPIGHCEDDTKVYASLGIPEGKPHVVTTSRLAAAPDELSITRGTTIAVLEKKSDGWWLAEFEGVRGMVPGCFLARRNAAKGIRLVKESEAVPSVNQSNSAIGARANLTTVNEASSEATRPKPQPVPKPRRLVASPLSSPLPSPLPSPPPSQLPSPSPRPTPRQTKDSPQPATKKDSSLESSSDEEEASSGQKKPEPPPPREASFYFRLTKQTALPEKGPLTAEKKVFRVCQDYEAVALGTVSLTKGQEVQVMPRPQNNGWMEVKIDGVKGFAPKECIEETKKPRKTKGKQKCDIQDIEDAYWSGDALEGERVLHSTQVEGTFMIRKSKSKENQETLLIYENGKILKYKIKQKQGSGYSLSKTDPIFESLEELIFFYSSNFLPKVTTKLRVPYQRLIST